MKRTRTPSMRKFALKIALEQPNLTGLTLVNHEAKIRGEKPYPESTWSSLVKNEVPRVKKYGNKFFDSHTDAPVSWGDLKMRWPI